MLHRCVVLIPKKIDNMWFMLVLGVIHALPDLVIKLEWIVLLILLGLNEFTNNLTNLRTEFDSYFAKLAYKHCMQASKW